jgi:hypothetical protein
LEFGTDNRKRWTLLNGTRRANQLYVGGVPQLNRTPTTAELAALPCRLTAAQAMVNSCNPQAGVITTAAIPARQIQLGLKVVF